MKGVAVALVGLALAGFAVAQEETGEYDPDRDILNTPKASETYEPGRDIVTDEDRKPDVSLGETKTDSPLNTEFGTQESVASDADAEAAKNRGLAKAKAKDLEGRKVVTLTGEEVGEIGKVGSSPAHGRVATIDVGGFLGVGEKTIAVPLSNLHRTPSDGEQVRISLMRTSIESAPEFDESTLTAEE